MRCGEHRLAGDDRHQPVTPTSRTMMIIIISEIVN
jgi:hypothetical protein